MTEKIKQADLTTTPAGQQVRAPEKTPTPQPPTQAVVPAAKNSPVLALATMLQFADAASFARTLKATVMPGSASDEQVAMLCSVALAHGLNPLKREIYAFPDKGGIRPIIGVDGWYTIANSHPMMDGISFRFEGELIDPKNGKGSLSCRCTIHRKDRAHPIEVEEYLSECFRNTEPWKNNTRRMLQHRAAIQCIRIAFGLAGIMDEEEFARMVEFENVRSKPLPEDALRHGGVRTGAQAISRLEQRHQEREPVQEGQPEEVPFTVADEQPQAEPAGEFADPGEIPPYRPDDAN